MARSAAVIVAISMGMAGCARGPAQPTAQGSEAIASLQRDALPGAPSAGESATLADAPRHAQDSQNATVGEYVLPPSEPPSASTKPVHGPDPDFAEFDVIKRSLEGDSELSGPGDQGTSELDRKMTERIRKAMLSDPRLSYNAKSIGIVTKDGRVTLKGIVNNSKERIALEEIAARAVGSDRMVSEVKIK